jgi:hypothetical protein
LGEADKPVKLIELYNTAGQYYATVLIAVVFAQFSVLTFLRGKYNFWGSPEMLPILFLIFVYCVVLRAGWYFGGCFLKFSELLDQTIANSQFDPTAKRLAEDIEQTHFKRREQIVRSRTYVLGVYVGISLLVLLAVFYIR